MDLLPLSQSRRLAPTLCPLELNTETGAFHIAAHGQSAHWALGAVAALGLWASAAGKEPLFLSRVNMSLLKKNKQTCEHLDVRCKNTFVPDVISMSVAA